MKYLIPIGWIVGALFVTYYELANLVVWLAFAVVFSLAFWLSSAPDRKADK